MSFCAINLYSSRGGIFGLRYQLLINIDESAPDIDPQTILNHMLEKKRIKNWFFFSIKCQDHKKDKEELWTSSINSDTYTQLCQIIWQRNKQNAQRSSDD